MALTQVNGGMLDSVAQQVGFRNRIINGAMMIDQRNAGASVTPTNGQYTVDRWKCYSSQASKFTAQQSSDAPTGFINSTLFTSSSAYTPISTDYFGFVQPIEGLNVSDFAWGTASAKAVTLSFWVKSSLTGTFGGTVYNSSGTRRSYVFSYTISSASTWEYKTVTVPGCTDGTWLTTNGVGILVWFSLGEGSNYLTTPNVWNTSVYDGPTGQTNFVATNGATFYVTGVQLEKGSTATSFDYRPYGTELALCQRYYYKVLPAGAGNPPLTTGSPAVSSTNVYAATPFPVPMRIAPTALEQSGTASNYSVAGNGTTTCNAVPTWIDWTTNVAGVSAFQVASGLTAGQCYYGRCNNTAAYLAWSAEL